MLSNLFRLVRGKDLNLTALPGLSVQLHFPLDCTEYWIINPWGDNSSYCSIMLKLGLPSVGRSQSPDTRVISEGSCVRGQEIWTLCINDLAASEAHIFFRKNFAWTFVGHWAQGHNQIKCKDLLMTGVPLYPLGLIISHPVAETLATFLWEEMKCWGFKLWKREVGMVSF